MQNMFISQYSDGTIDLIKFAFVACDQFDYNA